MENNVMKPLMPRDGRSVPVSEKARYTASQDYILRQVAGENVLVCVGESPDLGNSILSLNETCAFLWELYQAPLTLEEALELAKKEYEDPEGVMESHIRSFVWQSVQLGLLTEA